MGVPQKILIIPDKFKGTLTAHAAAEAIARGWREARPRDVLRLLPMSDGGDGFGDVMGKLLRAQGRLTETVNAAGQPCKAQWWWEPKSKTAIVESAAVIGLAMLPPGRFHPFELDTFGLGAVFRAAAEKGARRCLIGIGGSATNDGGFGLARALGWEFFDGAGNAIERWTGLSGLAHIRKPKRTLWFDELVVAVDVQNPLLGPRGATRIYGPQKGLQPDEFAIAERCLRRLANVVRTALGVDCAREPGAGAAGGLGFGLRAFPGAGFEPGFALFAHHAQLDRRLRAAKLVITGEGAIDQSTLMGKGAGQVAERCREAGIPCIGLAGVVTAGTRLKRLFADARGLTELTSASEAKAEPALWLEQLATKVASEWQGRGRGRAGCRL